MLTPCSLALIFAQLASFCFFGLAFSFSLINSPPPAHLQPPRTFIRRARIQFCAPIFLSRHLIFSSRCSFVVGFANSPRFARYFASQSGCFASFFRTFKWPFLKKGPKNKRVPLFWKKRGKKQHIASQCGAFGTLSAAPMERRNFVPKFLRVLFVRRREQRALRALCSLLLILTRASPLLGARWWRVLQRSWSTRPLRSREAFCRKLKERASDWQAATSDFWAILHWKLAN